ncbi:MAG: diguanylate cyclase domain-containing protein [Coriobacteriales bacterium]
MQGYYFSRPVPAAEFERFIIEGRQAADAVDALEKPEAPAPAPEREKRSFGDIAHALVGDYFHIYSVRLSDGHFVEYNPREDVDGMGYERRGSDFFSFIREETARNTHPDDVDMLLKVLTKEGLAERLNHVHSFNLTYRLMIDSISVYVSMRAAMVEDEKGEYVVLAVSSIGERMRADQEHDEGLITAYRDVLTGVKSKYACSLESRMIDQALSAGVQEPFALVRCDVNGLRSINESQGHGAGDKSLKEACQIVCAVFAHSPVFRVDGDEFAVIVRGDDYAARDELLEQLAARNREQAERGAVTVAVGNASYKPGVDQSFVAVFDRAEPAMREEKAL